MSNDKTLTLPTIGGGCETFDMRGLKLVVRCQHRELSSIFIFDGPQQIYKCQNEGATRGMFNSALALVGKFLSDNPTF